MTEKRFTSQRTDDYNYSDILDNGKWIGICHVDCEDDFVDKFNELHEEKEIYKMLWEQMSYYFEDGIELKDLDHKDFRSLQRLAKGLVD